MQMHIVNNIIFIIPFITVYNATGFISNIPSLMGLINKSRHTQISIRGRQTGICCLRFTNVHDKLYVGNNTIYYAIYKIRVNLSLIKFKGEKNIWGISEDFIDIIIFK